MKIKSQLTLATLIVAGMFAAGCSQQQAVGSQQTAKQAAPVEHAGKAAPVAAGACNPKADKWCHSHPAIPGCTNSITHSHQFTDPNHKHAYSCKGGRHAGHAPVVPHVKAKGVYKGAVSMDAGSRATMKQYQK